MSPDTEHLFQMIQAGNPFQSHYIDKMKHDVMEQREYDILEFLVSYFKNQGISVEQQAEAYLHFVQETMEEQLYFRKNHCYRADNYEKVCQPVYKNNQRMSDYVVALALTDCIWSNHIYSLRWYEEELRSVCAQRVNTYMEVGCGLGINLLRTMQLTNAVEYRSIDLSQRAVELCGCLLSYAKERDFLGEQHYTVICEDFFNSQILKEVKADIFVMFEVLEHVPNPGDMLDRIKQLTSDDAQIFVSTAINSPMPDHIYLFRSVREVLNMMDCHGFVVENKICAAANNVNIEEAERRQLPITIALRLRKQCPVCNFIG